MSRTVVIAFLVALLLTGCQQREEPASTAGTDSAAAGETPAPPVQSEDESGSAPSPAAAAATDAVNPGSSTAGGAVPVPGGAPASSANLASQETNWSGVVAEVTELRRKGNTLPAKVRFRNQGGAVAEPDVHYNEVYVMDLGAGKKYEVLKDEKGNYIAGLRSGWNNRWYDKVQPGQSATIWMKFPAPPADVKTVTLQVPGIPPFEDLPIQDT
ncbi:MAG TPA: hypothetical protein VE685_19140 [Thermoanaerobaculia bacterium]|nr:hypothetical protein [Thermoanaerobaculia bacterium]